MDLILNAAELEAVTGYRQPSRQLAELRRQGFVRARRNRLGDVVLERGHYDAIVAGRSGAPAAPKARPPVLPQ